MARLDLSRVPPHARPAALRRFAPADRALCLAVADRLERARAGRLVGPLVTDVQLHQLAALVRS